LLKPLCVSLFSEDRVSEDHMTGEAREDGESGLRGLRLCMLMLYSAMIGFAVLTLRDSPTFWFAIAYLAVSLTETLANVLWSDRNWAWLGTLQIGIPFCGFALLADCSIYSSLCIGGLVAAISAIGFYFAVSRRQKKSNAW
jgi:hypothetical protein